MEIISAKNIKPNKGILLLEVPDKPTETVSGLMLANENSDSVPMSAKILAVGVDSPYAVGQEILFRRYSVDQLTIKDKEAEKRFYLLQEDDVLATIN